MEIRVITCLPRDEASVPVARHLFVSALRELRVDETCTDDLALALTEACTNVLKHTTGTNEEYEVQARITDTECKIEVLDSGGGFNTAALDRPVAALEAESGRGIYLMRALVDELHFTASPNGTSVHLSKTLQLKDGSILRRDAHVDLTPAG